MNQSNFLQKHQLVDLSNDPDFLIQMVYATPNNFTGKKLYDQSFCFLRKKTYRKLKAACQILKDHNCRLVIWDAYRPLSIQRKMWQHTPDERFVANPHKSHAEHCKGSAVDVTLADLDSNLLSMPTKFDHFGPESFRENLHQCSPKIQKNVALLTDTMHQCGFEAIPTEWWHFNDSDHYPYIDA